MSTSGSAKSDELDQRSCMSLSFFALQVNNKLLMGLFHEEIVASLRNLPLEVCLVCARRVTPKTSTEDMSLRGTIVDNMHVGRTERAFASRVSEVGGIVA